MAYFPNGTAGEVLDNQCGECKLSDEAPCPVLFVQMTFNYSQLDDGNKPLREAMDYLVNEDGRCQMKDCIDKNIIQYDRRVK